LEQARHLPLQEGLDRVLAEVQEWHGAGPLRDDVSLLAVEVGGDPRAAR
jgi:hypothetical protein